MKLKTFILNLPQRQDRRINIEKEFRGKNLYDIEYLCPIRHECPRISHWLSLKHCVIKAKMSGYPFFLFCEDDHIFTSAYNENSLVNLIKEANALRTDILLGGISWFLSTLQISDFLFWTEEFNGTQFTIIYKRFYDKIISYAKINETLVTDFILSKLSDRIITIYPFISIQKEFGYSDITKSNNVKGYVESLFENTQNMMYIQDKVRNYYKRLCQ